MVPSSEEVTGGTHFPGINKSDWHETTSEQRRNFKGVNSIVFSFSTIDQFHVKSVALALALKTSLLFSIRCLTNTFYMTSLTSR